jgi:hypothetical protein
MAAALLLLWAAPAQAQTAGARPRYEVHRAAAPITIDGKIDPKEWVGASPAMDFIFPWDSQTGAKQRTRARMLWDDEYLYVAYDAEDTDITAQVQQRDEFVYRDDTVELFLNVKPSQTMAYYCIEMNVRGVVMDYVCIDAQNYMRRFDMEGLKIGIQIDGTLNMRGDKDRGFMVELAIPWKNFADMTAPPKIGTVFTGELNRWDGVDPDRRLSVWVDSKLNWPHPHAPENFGELVFVK